MTDKDDKSTAGTKRTGAVPVDVPYAGTPPKAKAPRVRKASRKKAEDVLKRMKGSEDPSATPTKSWAKRQDSAWLHQKIDYLSHENEGLKALLTATTPSLAHAEAQLETRTEDLNKAHEKLIQAMGQRDRAREHGQRVIRATIRAITGEDRGTEAMRLVGGKLFGLIQGHMANREQVTELKQWLGAADTEIKHLRESLRKASLTCKCFDVEKGWTNPDCPRHMDDSVESTSDSKEEPTPMGYEVHWSEGTLHGVFPDLFMTSKDAQEFSVRERSKPGCEDLRTVVCAVYYEEEAKKADQTPNPKVSPPDKCDCGGRRNCSKCKDKEAAMVDQVLNPKVPLDSYESAPGPSGRKDKEVQPMKYPMTDGIRMSLDSLQAQLDELRSDVYDQEWVAYADVKGFEERAERAEARFAAAQRVIQNYGNRMQSMQGPEDPGPSYVTLKGCTGSTCKCEGFPGYHEEVPSEEVGPEMIGDRCTCGGYLALHPDCPKSSKLIPLTEDHISGANAAWKEKQVNDRHFSRVEHLTKQEMKDQISSIGATYRSTHAWRKLNDQANLWHILDGKYVKRTQDSEVKHLTKQELEDDARDMKTIREAEKELEGQRGYARKQIPTPTSFATRRAEGIAQTVEEAKAIIEDLGIPVVLMPSFSLDGEISSITNDAETLGQLQKVFKRSPVHEMTIAKLISYRDLLVSLKEAQKQISNLRFRNAKLQDRVEAPETFSFEQEIQKDPIYAWTWHCNLVMAFMDSGGDPKLHATATEASRLFMKRTFNVDVKDPGLIDPEDHQRKYASRPEGVMEGLSSYEVGVAPLEGPIPGSAISNLRDQVHKLKAERKAFHSECLDLRKQSQDYAEKLNTYHSLVSNLVHLAEHAADCKSRVRMHGDLQNCNCGLIQHIKTASKLGRDLRGMLGNLETKP